MSWSSSLTSLLEEEVIAVYPDIGFYFGLLGLAICGSIVSFKYHKKDLLHSCVPIFIIGVVLLLLQLSTGKFSEDMESLNEHIDRLKEEHEILLGRAKHSAQFWSLFGGFLLMHRLKWLLSKILPSEERNVILFDAQAILVCVVMMALGVRVRNRNSEMDDIMATFFLVGAVLCILVEKVNMDLTKLINWIPILLLLSIGDTMLLIAERGVDWVTVNRFMADQVPEIQPITGDFMISPSMIHWRGVTTVLPAVTCIWIWAIDKLSRKFDSREENMANLLEFQILYNGGSIFLQLAITIFARLYTDDGVWYFNPLSGDSINQPQFEMDLHVVGICVAVPVMLTTAYCIYLKYYVADPNTCHKTLDLISHICVNRIFPIVQFLLSISGAILSWRRAKTKVAIVHKSTILASALTSIMLLYHYNITKCKEMLTYWVVAMMRMYSGGVQTRLTVIVFQCIFRCEIYNNASIVVFQVMLFAWTFPHFYYATDCFRRAPMTAALIMFSVFMPFWVAIAHLSMEGGNVCYEVIHKHNLLSVSGTHRLQEINHQIMLID